MLDLTEIRKIRWLGKKMVKKIFLSLKKQQKLKEEKEEWGKKIENMKTSPKKNAAVW